jgi:hypothetical protein
MIENQNPKPFVRKLCTERGRFINKKRGEKNKKRAKDKKTVKTKLL